MTSKYYGIKAGVLTTKTNMRSLSEINYCRSKNRTNIRETPGGRNGWGPAS
jgi:hypothetical protein